MSAQGSDRSEKSVADGILQLTILALDFNFRHEKAQRCSSASLAPARQYAIAHAMCVEFHWNFSSSQPSAAISFKIRLLNASHASDGAVDLDCDGQEVNACGDGMDC